VSYQFPSWRGQGWVHSSNAPSQSRGGSPRTCSRHCEDCEAAADIAISNRPPRHRGGYRFVVPNECAAAKPALSSEQARSSNRRLPWESGAKGARTAILERGQRRSNRKSSSGAVGARKMLVPARFRERAGEVGVANSQHQSCQDSPVMFGVAGSNPRNSMMRHRWDSVGRFWFFSHFSIAVSVIPSPSSFASCVMDSERSIRFLRRCSPSVVGVAG